MHIHPCDHGCVCQEAKQPLCPACEIKKVSSKEAVTELILKRFGEEK